MRKSLWYAYVCNCYDNLDVRMEIGPLPLEMIEPLLPEIKTNDRGEPIEYIMIERA